MTCKEKLKELHPNWYQDELDETFNNDCPCDHMEIAIPRYDDGSAWCGYNRCEACWNREIPGTNSNDCITTTNEKEKNMPTKKTKAELMEELEKIKNDKETLEKELKNLEKYKQYEDAAGEVHAMYTAFVHSGFSEEQAFELVKTMMANAAQINFAAPPKPTYKSYR